jgi:hypothetical protein
MTVTTTRQRFQLILIRSSHYDDNGYVIQWLRSAIPSYTLIVLHGLAADCRDRRALGDDIDLDIIAYDETNTRIRPDRIAAAIRAAGGLGMVAMVGVRSNQFPRASASAGFTCPAASPCCRNCRPTFARRRRWGSSCSPERPSSDLMPCCGMPSSAS